MTNARTPESKELTAMTAMPEDADPRPMVAAEFDALADLLTEITDDQWDTPSLCEGWRVREVVAHMTMPARYSVAEFQAELRACEGDFTKLSNTVASRDAALPTTELVANLRSDIMKNWVPPGGDFAAALNHVVIHGLDATVPLGTPVPVPEPTIRAVLDELTVGGTHRFFGIDIDGRGLRATDLDWSYGSGPELLGTGGDLALAICGRTLPAGRLTGDPLR